MGELLRRRAMMAPAGNTPLLPPEYQQVEWIWCTSTGNYLDAGKAVSASTVKVSCRINVISESSSEKAVLMTKNGSNTAIQLGLTGKRLFNYSSGIGSASITFTSIVGDTIDVIADRPTSTKKTLSATIGGTPFYAEKDGANTDTANNATIYVLSASATSSGAANIKMAWMKIEFPTKTIDLYACYRKSDGKIGMYDVANSEFREAVGNGWQKGADV